MIEYTIQQVSDITGLAPSTIRAIRIKHRMGRTLGKRVKLITADEVKRIFELSEKARLFRAARRNKCTK